eukprot:1154648-Pelagomonas_calceolata.AAC.2
MAKLHPGGAGQGYRRPSIQQPPGYNAVLDGPKKKTLAYKYLPHAGLFGRDAQIQSEFPNILPIKESLIKYVFEPNAAKKDEVKNAVREMRKGA